MYATDLEPDKVLFKHWWPVHPRIGTEVARSPQPARTLRCIPTPASRGAAARGQLQEMSTRPDCAR